MIVIFYFTGTGNTKYVCDYLSEVMSNKNVNTKAIDITNITTKKANMLINQSNIVFLAYPIYGSDMPENMKAFIQTMPNVKDKILGVICTQYLFSGDGASIMYKKLHKKGYNQRWAYQINMPSNLSLKGSPFHQSADYEYHETKHLQKARIKIERIAQNIENNKKRLGDHTIIHKIMAMSQRPLYSKIERKKYTKALNINYDKCTTCGLCVDSCPNNVLIIENGRVIFKNREKCTVCLRCLNFCPQVAITFNGGNKEPLFKGPTKEIYKQLFKKNK